jgi:hypothetical protein
MLGLSVDEFLRAFPNRTNALNYRRGRMLRERVSGRVAVLGVEAWMALGLPPCRQWGRHVAAHATFYLLPHPSGRCRLYNKSANRARLRRLFCGSSTSRSTTTGSPLRE